MKIIATMKVGGMVAEEGENKIKYKKLGIIGEIRATLNSDGDLEFGMNDLTNGAIINFNLTPLEKKELLSLIQTVAEHAR